MYSFAYHRASGVEDARQRLSADPAAKLIAGGMTLLPVMKHRMAAPSLLVDIGALKDLRGISLQGDVLTVGAAMRHREIAEDALLVQSIAALAQCARSIGDPQVRSRGTLGGAIANNDPAADFPAAVLGLKGVVVTDRRSIADGAYFLDMYTTALEEGEIVTAVRFSKPVRAAYEKFPNPASGYAMAGVFVAEFEEAGSKQVRVAVTGAAPFVFRWTDAERALSRAFSVQSLAALELPAQGLNSDLHASAAYRAHLVRVMAMRAVAQLTGETA